MKNKKLSICSLICGDASQSTALLHEVLLHILFSIFLLVVTGTNVTLCEPGKLSCFTWDRLYDTLYEYDEAIGFQMSTD